MKDRPSFFSQALGLLTPKPGRPAAPPRPIAPIVLPGVSQPVAVRRSTRARRIRLRVDAAAGRAELVVPRRASLAEAEAFARSQAGWLAARLASVPARVTLTDGASLPLRGVPHLLRAVPGKLGVKVVDGVIEVGGTPERLASRLLAWLKREARAALTALSLALAQRVNRKVLKIGLRDPRSRWGSCGGKGNLSFSWRLILAPANVLAYVAAHEVAHLVHRDHSSAFWAQVAALDPGFEAARAWLRRQGATLHLYVA